MKYEAITIMEIKNIDAEVQKEWENSNYQKFPYSKQLEDLGAAHVRLVYNDGNVIEPLSKHYKGLSRTNMKSASVISESGKILFTLDIVNDKLIYRKRNMVPPIQDQEKMKDLAHPKYGHMWFTNPKRCIILATEGRIVFVWDSGEITEITQWGTIEPYTKPELVEGEE